VVGRDRIAEHGEDAGAEDVLHRCRLERHALEERRPGNVGRASIPFVPIARRDRQCPPALITLEDAGVRPAEQLRADRIADDGPDLLGRRPQVGQEDRLPVVVDADRLRGEIHVDPAGEGEGHDKRR